MTDLSKERSPRRHNSGMRVKREKVQLRQSGSKPGGALPIFTRWPSIRLISSGSSMTAITFISAPHFGQTSGSTSYSFASSLTHARLRALTLTSSPSPSGSNSGPSGSGTTVGCEALQPAGARSAAYGIRSHRPFVREAYSPYRRISCRRFGGMC